MVNSIIPDSILNAIRDTLSIQASTPVQILSVETIQRSPLPDVSLIAAVGMNSTQFAGTLAICFPANTFLGLVSHMLGETFTELTPENTDAAGELLNIIYASARAKINQAGHDFTPALPTTTRGPTIQIGHPGSNSVVRATCKTEYGPFYFEMSLRPKTS